MEYYLALSLSIARPVSGDGCRDQSEGLIARWQAFDPHAPAATIFYAEHLLAKGWCVRGSGFAQTVSPQAWKVFHEMSGKALNLLESRNSAAVDPQYYAVMAKIYRATGKDETAMMGLLERAFSAEPGYYETYYAASEYFKPQWNGGPDGYDRFARFAMDRAKKQEGRGMYARLYLYEADCNCRHTLPAPDRELMKEALRDIIVRWPVGRNVNRAIQEACMVQDYAESAELFRLLGSDDAAMGWSSPADQSDCREKTQQWQTLRGRSR